MSASLKALDRILKEYYLPSMPRMDKDLKPSDNPYKPGSKEFNTWNKDVLMSYQRTPDVYHSALVVANERLARLKESYPKGVILDPDIDLLVNGTPLIDEEPVVDLTPYRNPFYDVNETWAKTEQYIIVNPMMGLMPQIDSAPDWVSDQQLYSILVSASQRDLKEVEQQYGFLFYAVRKPLSIQQAQALNQFSVDQVRVRYERWMR